MNFFSFLITHRAELLAQTYQHVVLTLVALLFAVGLGVPVGLWLTRHKDVSTATLGATGVIQTIPSLALLGFLIPLTGIGAPPAIIALFLYALLPIVRNAFTGVEEVDPAVKEAAVGMGMSDAQVLRKVELPLALPVIFAGIRTATVINVGIATLCALIGAGGLGVYIFRGISLNNTTMVIAGAAPAALLALLFDGVLALVQRRLALLLKPLIALIVVLLLGTVIARYWAGSASESHLRVGMPPEFMERADGYPGFRSHYDLDIHPIEIEHGIMYRALHEGKVDAVMGYSTDGEIAAFDLVPLEDDRRYFPPYYVAPLVRTDLLEEHGELRGVLNRLAGTLDDRKMAQLNARVDQDKEGAATVARDFLASLGLRTAARRRSRRGDVVIGSKIFAEQYILAEAYAQLIENYTRLSVTLKTGLGGTKICFDALTNGEIDLYPEYTGTGLLAILDVPEPERGKLITDPGAVYRYVEREFARRFDLQWLEPLGFNNTYALILDRERARSLSVASISDLVARLSDEH